MNHSICGADCAQCTMGGACGGCAETGGRPFGGACLVAECCLSGGRTRCADCGPCRLKEALAAEFNALRIPDMGEVTDLNALTGSYINLTYTLPSGQAVRLLDDKQIYLGNQLHKRGSDRCYGLAAGRDFLLVCEYGEGGADAEIVLYKRR